MKANSALQLSCDVIGLGETGGADRVREFVASKLAPVVPVGAHIITIDGFDGVGKSRIAGYLAGELGLTMIGLDDFLEKQKGCFLEALKIDEILSKVTDTLDVHGRIIVEGCLVESVLERIGTSPNFRIYIMQVTRMWSQPEMEWIKEHDALYSGKSADELVAKLEELATRAAQMPEKFGGGGVGELPNLERELIRYHAQWRPHDCADVIVKMVHTS